MKIAPTTVLTTKALLSDEIAADLKIWNIETQIHGQTVAFYLYQHGKWYELFMTRPHAARIGRRGTLKEIVELYNKCISTSKDSHGWHIVSVIQKVSHANV